MRLEIIFVVLQSLSTISLALVGGSKSKAIKRDDGSLNRKGKAIISAIVIVGVSSALALYLSSGASQSRLERKIDDLRSDLAAQVMEAKPEAAPRRPEGDATTGLQILRPVDGEVDWRPTVEGRVTNPNAAVYVIVHPVGLSSYWVQPPVIVRRDGSWRVGVYAGRAGDIDIGKEFEIMAVAYPKDRLSEGQTFSAWPQAKWRSEVVTVVRK